MVYFECDRDMDQLYQVTTEIDLSFDVKTTTGT